MDLLIAIHRFEFMKGTTKMNITDTPKGAVVKIKENTDGYSAEVKCFAKINLALDVINKRPDGYHNVELIFDSINLYDTIDLKLTESEISLSCTDKTLPTDDKNIAYRAVEELFKYLNLNIGANINLNKNIPHGAGLAGGSADAAGVLLGLNELLVKNGYIEKPMSISQLMEIGVSLGADVPFCIMGGTAFAEGIGEILTPISKPALNYVIVKPDASISTAFVYNNLNLSNRPDNFSARNASKALNNGNLDLFVSCTGNIMEPVTAKEVPVIYDIKNALSENGALLSMMSGSGTSVFGAFKDLKTAISAAEKLNDFGKVFVC